MSSSSRTGIAGPPLSTDDKENAKDNQSPQSSPGSPGQKILKYMQSEYFAIKTEPIAVGDTIQEFIKRLLDENEKLERENQQIALKNLECERQA